MRPYETSWATALGCLLLASACGSQTSGTSEDPAGADSGSDSAISTATGTSGGVINGGVTGTIGAATSGASAASATGGDVGSTGVGGGVGADEEDGSSTRGFAGAAGAAGAASVPVPIEPGVLTAGIWDDNQNFDWFTGYYDDQQGNALSGWFRTKELEAAHERALELSGGHATLDISLVIDTTGSMSDELRYLQVEFDAISAAIESRYKNAEQRWSLIVYRDVGDEYVTRDFDFTADLSAFRADLAAQSSNGGGDFPEAPDQALRDMNQLSWRNDPSTLKLVFWVADAPHHQDEESVDDITAAIIGAQDQNIRINPVASSGVDEFTEFTMRSAAQLTLGQYLFLTDDSGVGGAHKEPTVPCYYVTTLSDALLRVVDAGMTGEPAPVDQNHVVRSVGNPDSHAVCEFEQTTAVAF